MGEREREKYKLGKEERGREGEGEEFVGNGWKDRDSFPRTNSFHPLSSAGRRQTLKITFATSPRAREREMKIIERDGEERIK